MREDFDWKARLRPDVISLAGGLPASELLPLVELQECFETVLRRDGARALQYSPMIEPLRHWICDTMRARGVTCEPEQVFITNGAQQGLTILSRLFLDPGQPAVIEAVTFTGIQQVTAGRGAAVRTVPTDLASGIDVDALEEAFSRAPRPRLAVVIPDFHNPLGVSLTLEKRQRIAELAARYQVPVIEDDPYSALRFEGAVVAAHQGLRRSRRRFLRRLVLEDAGAVATAGLDRRPGRAGRAGDGAARVHRPRVVDADPASGQPVRGARADGGTSGALQRCQPLPPRCAVRRVGAASRRARQAGRGRKAACSSG